MVGTVEAQRAREWQVHGVATLGADRFLGGGLGFAFRTDGRLRVGISTSLGDLEGVTASRAEAGLSFHLNPFKRRGVSPYGGGGVAGVFTRDASSGYLVVLVGVESSPGGRSGWFVEGGVGGGVRLGVGFRLRQRARRRR